ncbi:MAG TPA: site-specific DNA-methyltransferase [Clostridia bacterium]|nr:site-specific DNA-methyltransferase [Clostridia bacterium]
MKKHKKKIIRLEPAYSTPSGEMYAGDAKEILAKLNRAGFKHSAQLIFTSPPFVLNRKKKYGNLTGREYIQWLSSLAPLFADLLKPDGSIVIELGNGWVPGKPTMSTLPLEALLAFKRKGKFHLCQEFVCYNPARLPSPAQWVNVERCRVKDAFTRVWWLSSTPRPKADNRNVLTSYSDSMKKLLESGTYNPGHRPSEFKIGEKSFLTNNRGAIPPNVLAASIASVVEEITSQPGNVFALANTGSNDGYQEHCRKNDVPLHPARMPAKLVEFFIRFLTSANDLVIDPFAGSNTTGAVAEMLGRRWKSVEIKQDYIDASRVRFDFLQPHLLAEAAVEMSGTPTKSTRKQTKVAKSSS